MIATRWLQYLSLGRGAPLWLPSLWAAAALVLFGILQAASQRGFDNQTRELRVALGPFSSPGVPTPILAQFEDGLRRGLTAQRELSLLPPERLHERVAAVCGLPLPGEPWRWMRATRNLNVSYFVSARFTREHDLWAAQVEIWHVADESTWAAFDAVGSAPGALGRAVADSVQRALFRPRPATTASR